MVPEPARSLRMRFAQAFHTRSLRDLFGGRTDCFASELEFILLSSTSEVGKPSDQSKFLRRLYVEATQTLRRAQPVRVLYCSERGMTHAYPVHLGIQLSEMKCFFPLIARNQLYHVVGNALPQNKPQPLLLHVSARDRSGTSTWVHINILVQHGDISLHGPVFYNFGDANDFQSLMRSVSFHNSLFPVRESSVWIS